jgi:hypothetical protein
VRRGKKGKGKKNKKKANRYEIFLFKHSNTPPKMLCFQVHGCVLTGAVLFLGKPGMCGLKVTFASW